MNNNSAVDHELGAMAEVDFVYISFVADDGRPVDES